MTAVTDGGTAEVTLGCWGFTAVDPGAVAAIGCGGAGGPPLAVGCWFAATTAAAAPVMNGWLKGGP